MLSQIRLAFSSSNDIFGQLILHSFEYQLLLFLTTTKKTSFMSLMDHKVVVLKYTAVGRKKNQQAM